MRGRPPILVEGAPTTRHPLYATWCSLKQRREVVREWSSFARFVADVGFKPSSCHKLCVDSPSTTVAGPESCRWAIWPRRCRTSLEVTP